MLTQESKSGCPSRRSRRTSTGIYSEKRTHGWWSLMKIGTSLTHALNKQLTTTSPRNKWNQTSGFLVNVNRKHFANGVLRKRWRHDNHVISMTKFLWNANLKWPVIGPFSWTGPNRRSWCMAWFGVCGDATKVHEMWMTRWLKTPMKVL